MCSNMLHKIRDALVRVALYLKQEQYSWIELLFLKIRKYVLRNTSQVKIHRIVEIGK